MHLTVECPRCQNRYQLEPNLRGKKIRCQNSICQFIFEVQPVGESASPVLAPAPPEAPSPPKWNEAPPPVRRVPEAPVAVATLDALPDLSSLEEEPGPLAGPAWQGEAPPVRRLENPGIINPAPQAREALVQPLINPNQRGGRRSLTVAAILLVGLGLLTLAGFWLAGLRAGADEGERATRAEDHYRADEFAEACAAWQKMQRDFPRSPDYARYGFLAELAAVREAALSARIDPAQAKAALERALGFLQVQQNNPHLADRRGDIFLMLQRLSGELTEFAERNQDEDLLRFAQLAWSAADKYEAPASIDLLQMRRHHVEAFARIDKSLGERRHQARILAKIKEFTARPTLGNYMLARDLVRQGEVKDAGAFAQPLKDLWEGIAAAIVFVPTPGHETALKSEDRLFSFALVPRVGGEGALPETNGLVPVLARGVLYVLNASDGQLRWARRLGIDSTSPLRLAADAFAPERLLAVSSDAQALIALDLASGAELWRCRLEDPPSGSPIVLGRHALLVTSLGRVEEIELTSGRRLGHYFFGMPLRGAARQEGSHLVFLAAEQGGVFVLDAAKRQVQAVLLTEHEAGALRGPPQILAGGDQGYLLLTLAQGAAGLELRGYELPLNAAQPSPLKPAVKIAGATEFPAWHNGLHLALATDNGRLHFFGINQKKQRDPWLFPWLDRDYLVEPSQANQRGQIVHGEGQELWVAAGGKVQRLELTLSAKEGPRWRSHWLTPPVVGSPIQPGQWLAGPEKALVVTTQEPGGPTIWASAVSGQSGAVFWRRQLGATWQGPLVREGDWIGAPVEEGLVRFRPPQGVKADSVFGEAGLMTPWPMEREEKRLLVPTGGEGWLDLRWAGDQGDHRLRWRTFSPEGKKSAQLTRQGQGAVSGSPLILQDQIVVALANGLLERLNREDGEATPGLPWRAATAQDDQAFVGAALGGDEFITSDGRLRLTRWQWPARKLPPRLKAAVELDQRTTGLAVGPGGKQVAARQFGDQVTLLETENLEVVKQWRLPGKITGGPFFLGAGLGVVVEGKRLVWLTTAKDGLAWEYGLTAALVGEPVLVDGLVVVGDQAGSFIVLDPRTGRPAGPGYTMRAHVAPAASPLPLADGRLLVPLCDGTAVLMSLEMLRSAKK